MDDVLRLIHTNAGYIIYVVLLVATFLSFRVVEGGPPVSRMSSITMVLLDIHVTIGIVLYLIGGWYGANFLIAVAHPVLAIAALGAGHVGLGRARRESNPRNAAKGLAAALVLVTAAIGVASV